MNPASRPEGENRRAPHDAAPVSPLEDGVRAAFAPGGALSDSGLSYLPRAEQLEMALAVARCIAEHKPLVVEAGTGVGKTFAYLVPTLLSGERALVSTATKSLQDQLFLRDLPRLRDALKLPVEVALLKGRASYLCLHRLQQARQGAALPDRWAVRALARVERWAPTTATGDLAEIDGLDDRSPVIPLVTSTRENCLGSECPEFRGCHVVRARREAMNADVVVVNHHLFFADMVLRDSGVAEILPSVSVAVFDEAHQLSEAGVQFLGTMLGTGQLLDLARDLLATGLQLARGLKPWNELSAALELAARELRLAAAGPMKEVRGMLKLGWDERATRPPHGQAFGEALERLSRAAAAALEGVEAVAASAPDFDRLAERSRSVVSLCERFARPAPEGQVRWIDLSPNQARLVESPLDIREALREQLDASPKGWVFTSATLGDDERLSWFTESAGLDDASVLRLGSPFDYARNARLYVPRAIARPGEPEHPPQVAALAARLARALGGRTFVLTTTLRVLRIIADELVRGFAEHGDAIEVLVQGSAPKRALLQRYLSTPHAVLVGSQSFWEGIDVPGSALQCVVIDKLPFPPPHDPLVQARTRRLESQGRNPFADYFVAEAAVSLKQGAGRLIRSETDRGLLVVCDSRLAGKNYGRRLRQALPPMAAAETEDDALAWLSTLAREA